MELGITIYSTGGTEFSFKNLGFDVYQTRTSPVYSIYWAAGLKHCTLRLFGEY